MKTTATLPPRLPPSAHAEYVQVCALLLFAAHDDLYITSLCVLQGYFLKCTFATKPTATMILLLFIHDCLLVVIDIIRQVAIEVTSKLAQHIF